jgi:low affinity Fe/Cu permease
MIRKRRAHISRGPIGRALRRQAVQRASQGARNELIGIEDLDEDEIEELRPVPESPTDPHPQEEEVG